MPVPSMVKAQRRAMVKASGAKNPACSAAMSEWVKNRRGGHVPQAVYLALAKCRAAAKGADSDLDAHADRVSALKPGQTLKGVKSSPHNTGYNLGWEDAQRITAGKKHERHAVYSRLAKGRKAEETADSPFYEGHRAGLRDRLEDSPHAKRRRVRAILNRHLS